MIRIFHVALLLVLCLIAPAWLFAQNPGSVGIIIDRDPQTPADILVYTVTYKSPADKAGVKRGEKLLKVDGFAVTGAKLEDVAAKIRGEVGSSVVLTLQSLDGVVRDIPLTRVVLPKGPIVSVPPPMLTQSVSLSDGDKALIKQKILGLTTDQQRLRMMQLLTQLKDGKITKTQFLTTLNTEFP